MKVSIYFRDGKSVWVGEIHFQGLTREQKINIINSLRNTFYGVPPIFNDDLIDIMNKINPMIDVNEFTRPRYVIDPLKQEAFEREMLSRGITRLCEF